MQQNKISVIDTPLTSPPKAEISGSDACDAWPFNIPATFDSPIFVTDAMLDLTPFNQKATELADYFCPPSPELCDFLVSAIIQRQINFQKIQIPGPNGVKNFEIYVIPAAGLPEGAKKLLVLVRDLSLEQNLITALAESRQMFKDLVACSSDFSWETNLNGEFEYVSPKGALDYSAHELIGREARDFLCAPRTPVIAFEATDPITGQELWFYTFGGSRACLRITAIPKIGRDGIRKGARGVCQDITILKEQESHLEKARALEKLRIEILSAMRDLKAGDQLLTQTSAAIANALPGVTCRTARRRGDAYVFTRVTDTDIEDPDTVSDADFREIFPDKSNVAQSQLPDGPQPVTLNNQPSLYILTEYRHKINGAIFLTAAPGQALPASAADILQEASSHVGIAIEHIETHENLERLSRTDELTGLLNRRAFLTDAEARLYAITRRKEAGCCGLGSALLYLDLDNLKAVNDQTGHASGDFVIAAFGKKLASLTQGKHLAARIGGDEFLLLMTNTKREDAEALANQLVEYCKSLNEPVGITTPALGLSVGISIIHPRQNTEIGEVICRADEALYIAKKNGKGTFIVIESNADDEADITGPFAEHK